MKILIFGGKGFLGLELAKELVNLGHNVTIFDKNIKRKTFNKIKAISGDILNSKSLDKAVKKKDIVFNFAAITDIEESISNPLDTAKINIIGNINIALSCIKQNIKKMIFASTIYVHSSQGGFYKVSKQSAELFLEEFYKRNKLKYTVLRFGTIYGNNSSKKNGLKKIVFSAVKKAKLEYTGSKRAQRRYLHINDAIFACIKTIEKKYDNKNILITGKKIVKVLKVLKIVSNKLKLNKKIIFKNKKGLGHYDSNPYTYVAKKEEKFNFKTQTKIDDGIDELIAHCKKNNFYEKI
jgi:UDP-glucose 4-epimerase